MKIQGYNPFDLTIGSYHNNTNRFGRVCFSFGGGGYYGIFFIGVLRYIQETFKFTYFTLYLYPHSP